MPDTDVATPLRLVLVAGPFGSGTSALTGALHHAGLTSVPPHHRVPDPRTPNTFESEAFRAIVLRTVRERDLSVNPLRRHSLRQRLRAFFADLAGDPATPRLADGTAVAALKFPPASLVVPDIASLVDLRLVVVRRCHDEIEASRARRGWAPIYGAEGASRIESALAEADPRALRIAYATLVDDPATTLARVARNAGLEPVPNWFDMHSGARFVRRPPA